MNLCLSMFFNIKNFMLVAGCDNSYFKDEIQTEIVKNKKQIGRHSCCSNNCIGKVIIEAIKCHSKLVPVRPSPRRLLF